MCSRKILDWCANINDHFLVDGSKRNPKAPNLYIKLNSENGIVNVVLDVDNLIILGNDTKVIEELKHELHREFEMINLGILHFCLGVSMKTK